ncbi:MAG: hypothetical protein WAV23_00315 [Minisyncoccia bacterium]
MNKIENKKNVMIVVGIIVLVGVFYVGMSYGKSKIPSRGQGGQGAQIFGQNGRSAAGGVRGGGSFGSMTAGEILSKDAQSMTVKLRDGSSKIVFYTDKISVEKNVSGTSSDLVVGKQISVTGTTNSDGSITAQSVQIRPAMSVITAPAVTQ